MKIGGILPAIVLASVLSVVAQPSFACKGNGDCVDSPGQIKRMAPLPLLGSGLSGLTIVIGYSAYWFTRRRRSVD